VRSRRQCELLGLSRSTAYYQPAAETPENLRLLELIVRQYTARPFYGSRRMTAWLKSRGHPVNPKRVQWLLGILGLEAIHPRPRRRGDGQPHRVFPYLLRGVAVERPDQVWSADSTYLPLSGGFRYLAATIDWFSRFVVAGRLSNTLDGAFCRDRLDEALAHGRPEVFNTDQGV
jgi:putative transposase